MSNDTFTFDMGDFVASFPNSILYAKNHMWAIAVGDDGAQRYRFGLTAYAVRLLQDVYFLDWVVEENAAVQHRMMIGSIESKKAESDLFAPIGGELTAINQAVMEEPSLINADAYGEGWMIEIEAGQVSSELLTPDEYAAHLEEAWEVAQRTIKGQANH